MSEYRLGVIGAGNMAEAILRGALEAGILPREHVIASDPSADRRAVMTDRLGIEAAARNEDAVVDRAVVILAVKPQQIDTVLEQVGSMLGPPCLVVSIAAGVTIDRIASRCPAGARIVRTMPNTPMLVGRGMVGLSRGADATAEDAALVRELFGACAEVIEVPESKLDALTAVSGSGPAYFFYLVEALVEAGVAVGLDRPEATKLAETTFSGAAELLASGDVPASELRRRVTSPGGTTAAAIASLDADEFRNVVNRAVEAATHRSRELGRGH